MKFVTRQKRVIYNVGPNPKSKPISIMSKIIHKNFAPVRALTTIARFDYPAWETIVIPVGNVIVCKQGRTHYNYKLRGEEEEEEEDNEDE